MINNSGSEHMDIMEKELVESQYAEPGANGLYLDNHEHNLYIC